MPTVTYTHLESLMGPQAADQQLHGYQIALEYLRRRGIDTPALIDALGLRFMFADRMFDATSNLPFKSQDDRIAIIFPHPQQDWWSARLVTTQPVAPATGFGALTIPRKQSKMHCPTGIAPTAYRPPLLDWDNIPKHSPIYIHESAIKSINSAKLGYYAIGLNGVQGWSSKKYDKPLVDNLIDLPWKLLDLKPIIVFDSNVTTNVNVAAARQHLADRLHLMFGVAVATLDVPPAPDGTDQGFDDYAQQLTPQQLHDFHTQPPTPIEIGGYQSALSDMNAKVAVVRNISRIVEIDTGTQMTRAAFTDVNYAHVMCEDAEGNTRNFPKMWMADHRRTEVERLVYSPGQPKLTPQMLNLWTGMGTDPVAGPVDPWLALLEHGVPDLALRHWLIKWFAYPIQNLGGKLNTYLLFYGPQGVGKNALLAPFLQIYGVNSSVLSRERLVSDFNEGYAAKQFVNLDELHGGNSAEAVLIANKLKMLTTGNTLTVNGKGKATYDVDNHVNLVITSNYSDCIKLDEGDRRAAVIQFGTREHIIKAQDYWDAYFAWAGTTGPAHLHDYLQRVDLTGFDPHGRAPTTEWKEQVTDATRGPMEKFVRDLWEDSESALPVLMRKARVLTPDQLAIAYMPEETHKITPGLKNTLGQRMTDAGFKAAKIKVDGGQKRVWILDRTLEPTDFEALRQAYKSITSTTQSKF